MDSPEPRLAEPDELAHTARMLVAFNTEYDEPSPDPDWWADHLARLVDGGDTRVFLIGRPAVGLALFRLRTSTWAAYLEAYLAEMYVEPGRRGQGLGTRLLTHALEELRAEGVGYVDLGTTTADESAIALYEKLGFDCHEGRGPEGPLAIYYEKEL